MSREKESALKKAFTVDPTKGRFIPFGITSTGSFNPEAKLLIQTLSEVGVRNAPENYNGLEDINADNFTEPTENLGQLSAKRRQACFAIISVAIMEAEYRLWMAYKAQALALKFGRQPLPHDSPQDHQETLDMPEQEQE